MLISIITLIFPVLGLEVILLNIIIKFNKDEHINLKKYIFPIAFLLGMFGYNMSFGSSSSTDLTRYFDLVDSYRLLSLKEIFSLDTNNLYIRDLLFYFVSRTGDVHILPFIVGFIIYYIVFYVLFDMIERSSYKFKSYDILMLGIICIGIVAPYSTIGNIRCVLSYVLISFAVYRDTIQKKINPITLLLYILPIGLHTSSIIIVMIRLVSIILKKLDKVSICIAIALPTIIDLAHTYINYINIGFFTDIIKNAINQAYFYLYWTEGGWATAVESSIMSKIVKISGTIFLIIIIIMIIRKNSNNIDKKNKKSYINLPMINYLYFAAIFALGCLAIKTGAFWRFESIVVLFSPVIFIQLIEKDDSNKKFLYLIFGFSMMMLFINIIHQTRNMDAISTLKNYLTTSGIMIVHRIFKGILTII